MSKPNINSCKQCKYCSINVCEYDPYYICNLKNSRLTTIDDCEYTDVPKNICTVDSKCLSSKNAMIEILIISNHRCILSNVCSSPKEAAKIIKEAYNKEILNDKQNIDMSKSYCSNSNAMIVRKNTLKISNVTRWVAINKCLHPTDKIFTFAINYKYKNENDRVIKISAKSKTEALLLWHAYTSIRFDDKNIHINSIDVIFDIYEESKYGTNYGKPYEYKEKSEIPMPTPEITSNLI